MSKVVKFDIGTKIIYEDNEYLIKGYASLNEVLAKAVNPPYSEKIIKVSEIINEPENASNIEQQLVDIDDKDFQKALEKYKIIEPLLELKNRTTKDVEKVAKENSKGVATIFRWIEKYEMSGTVSSLASSYKNSGGKGKSRLGESVDTIIDSVIEEFYLHKQQYPLSTIQRKIEEKCIALDLKVPNINTIRNRVNSLSPKLIAKHRKGVSVRDTRGTPGKFPDVKMPLDIIQIDHTKVDVIIVDEETREEIGRPFITVAIDVYSRMIYGFYISLEAVNYFSVGQCLLHSILPKDDMLRLHNFKGEWPVYGLPRAVHMDNGADFQSSSLKKFCQEYKIYDIYRPVARPEFGGHVERVIKTMMDKAHEIPGSTSSNIFQKGKYNSQKEALVTISELEEWYTQFVVDIYHKTVHSSIGMTPEEKFYEGMYGVGGDKIPFLPQVPANTIKLRMALLPGIKRSVQKNGITIDYITYFSETLRKWIIPAQYKKFNKLSTEVLCRRDPRDISKLYVYDPDINDYITVPYSDIKKPALNQFELRKAISEAKRMITGRGIESHDVFAAHNKLEAIIDKAQRETKQTKKSVRRNASSKKHQKKTLDYDKKVLTGDDKISVSKDINLANNSDDSFEDDDAGFEYYEVD